MYHNAAVAVCLAALIASMTAEHARGQSLVLTPSITIEESYESNASLSPEGAESPEGVESPEVVGNPEDFLTIVSPRIEILRETGKGSFTFYYDLTIRNYSQLPDNNFLSHEGFIGINRSLTRTTNLSISDSAIYTEDSWEVIESAIQVRRSPMRSNTANINLEHQFTPATTTQFALTDNRVEFEDETLVDSRSDVARIDTAYQWSPQFSITMTYGYLKYFFYNQGVESDMDGHSVQLGFIKNFSQSMTFELSGGVFYSPSRNDDSSLQDDDSSLQDDDSSSQRTDSFDWLARAAITKSFQNSSIDLNYLRNVTSLSGLIAGININERVSATWAFTFSPSFGMDLFATYSKNYTEPASDFNTTSYNGGITVNWSPRTWFTSSAGYSRFKQTARGVIAQDITNERVFIRMTFISEGFRI